MKYQVRFGEDHHYDPEPPLLLRQQLDNGRVALITRLEWTAFERGAASAVVTAQFDDGPNLLQAMIDYAWEQGMRPKGFADHSLQVVAMRDHIEDLRKFGFALLGAEAERRDPPIRFGARGQIITGPGADT